jgi:uncharacterized hydrophobic protein (TIGR00271 family)
VTSESQHGAGSDDGRLFRRIELRASPEQRNALYKSILESSHIDFEYAALLTLAGLIALFGLLENSAAVIIGAMLISPLMNPILSAALALLLGDGKLGKRSATVLVLSVVSAVGISWLVAFLIPLKQATPEILARTAPNLLDLFIAFLSGLAGTLALRGGSVAMTILPGVAIAVAVVPPLSVVGYGLSTHHGSIAGGAFLLFVTNLVSIILSAAGVFRIMGFQPQRQAEQGRWKFKYRMGASALVLILLSIPLFLTLRKAAIQVSIRSEVQRELNKAFEKNKASVSALSFSNVKDGLLIETTLQTTHYLETDAILSVENNLRAKYGDKTKLVVNQILVTQGGVAPEAPARSQNPISAGIVKAVDEKAAFDFSGAQLKSLELVQSQLDAVLAGTSIQRKAPPEVIVTSSSPIGLRLQLASPEPLTAQTISLLASQLGSRLDSPVQLHGEVELQAPSFHLDLTPAKPSLPLSAKDRAAVSKMIQEAQKGSLRLQVIYTSDRGATGGKQAPAFVSEIRRLLSRSGLNGSQWTITANAPAEPAPSTAAGAAAVAASPPQKGPAAAAPTPFRCELTALQDF